MAKLVTRMRWLQHEKNIGELHQNNLARNVVAKKQFRKEKASRIDFPPNEKAPRNIFPFRPPATKIRIPHPPSIRHLAWFFNSSAAKLCQGEERLTNMIVSGHPLNLPKGRIIHFESYQCVSKLREYRSTWIRFQLAKWKKNIGVVQMSKWSNLKFKKKVQKSQHLLNIGKKNWSYDNPPVPKVSWWDPILGSHEAATCRQVHCQSPRSCHTCVVPPEATRDRRGFGWLRWGKPAFCFAIAVLLDHPIRVFLVCWSPSINTVNTWCDVLFTCVETCIRLKPSFRCSEQLEHESYELVLGFLCTRVGRPTMLSA